MKKIFPALIFVPLALAVGCAHLADNDRHWVGTWGASPQLTEPRNLPPPPGLSSNTLRQVVHVSLGGKKLRVRFSNAFGDGPLTMAAVRVAVSAGGGAIKTKTEKTLMFAGGPDVTIPAREMIFSDVLDFDLASQSDVAVTIYFHETPRDVLPGREQRRVGGGTAGGGADAALVCFDRH